jgi:hypothetical protein
MLISMACAQARLTYGVQSAVVAAVGRAEFQHVAACRLFDLGH